MYDIVNNSNSILFLFSTMLIVSNRIEPIYQLILFSQVCQEVLHTACWLKSEAVHCSKSVLWLDFLYRTLELQGCYVVLQPQHHYLLLLLIFCVSKCFACIYVIALHVCAWCPWWSVEKIGFPGCDSPSRYWESNLILCKSNKCSIVRVISQTLSRT